MRPALPLIRRLSRIKVTTGREPTFKMIRIVKIPLPAGHRRRRPRRSSQLNRLDRIVQEFLSRCKETPAKSTNRRRLELGRRSIRRNRNCKAIPVLLSPSLRAHTSNVNIYIKKIKRLFHEHGYSRVTAKSRTATLDRPRFQRRRHREWLRAVPQYTCPESQRWSSSSPRRPPARQF